MANVFGVQPMGNDMALLLDDGTKLLTKPTASGIWILSNPEAPGPGPGGGKFRWPFDPRPGNQGGTVGSEYGMRNGRMHWGIDFGEGGITAGTPIHAAGDARVVQNVPNHSGWGNFITLDFGNNLFALHAHMRERSPLGVGTAVTKWQVIGSVGNTGASFGNHLHWETYEGGLRQNQAINPRTWMQRYGE